MIRIADMKHKEIINTIDGSRLGYICDVELDLKEGKINKVIIPGPSKIMGIFGKNLEYAIPWEKIKKIGEDIILIEIDTDEYLKETEY